MMGCAYMIIVLTGALGGLVEIGDYYFNRGYYGQAEQAYTAARYEDPVLASSAELLQRLGMVHFFSGEYKSAAMNFENAFYSSHNNGMKAEALIWIGRSLFAEGDYQGADRYFSQVIKYEPRLPLDFLYFFGLTLYQEGRVSDAYNLFQNLYEQAGKEYNRDELRYLLGLCMTKTGNYKSAQFYLEEILPTKEENWFGDDAVYLLALCDYYLGEKNKAIGLIDTMGQARNRSLRDRSMLLLGTIFLEEQKFEKAIAVLKPVVEDSVDSGNRSDSANWDNSAHQSDARDQAIFRTGYAYFKQGVYKKAVEYFCRILQAEPELATRALFLSGEAYNRLKRPAEAAERYQELVTRFPETGYREAGQFKLAQAYLQAGDYQKAQMEFRTFLTLFPKSGQQTEAEYRLAFILDRLQRYEEALGYLDRVETHSQSNYLDDARYLAGSILLNLKRYDEARARFEKVGDGILKSRALKGIGDAFFEETQYHKAITAYREALAAHPKEELADDVRFQIERAYLKLGVYGSELEMFRNYVRKYPSSAKSPELQFEVGVQFYQKQNYQQAIAEFERLVNNYSRHELAAEGLELMGKSYSKLNQVDAAIATFGRVIETYKNSTIVPRVLEELGRLYAGLDRFADALQAYSQLVREYPNKDLVGPVLLEMGRLYEKLGKWREAKTVLVRLVNQYSKSELLKDAKLELVRVYKGESNWRSAERAINEFLEKYGPTGDGYWEWAEIERAQAKYQTAQELFVKASEYYGANRDRSAQALFEAGLCALQTGKPGEAKDLFLRVEILAVDERLRIEAKRKLSSLEQ